MGMYDYLGPEQVKIFYHPIFQFKVGKSETWHSGGMLANYNEEDELPLKTLYYKYPKNFIVYDYSYSEGNLWVVKNGKYKKYISYKDLTEEDLGEAVFNYYGKELNIKTINDFNIIKEEHMQADKKYGELTRELFPEGIFNVIKNNLTEYETKKETHDQNYNKTWGLFYEKWYKNDEYKLEKQLGEYLECFMYLLDRKNEEINDWCNPMDDYLNCKQAIKDFIVENEGIINKYVDWLDLNNDEDEIIEKLNNLIQQIKEEN